MKNTVHGRACNLFAFILLLLLLGCASGSGSPTPPDNNSPDPEAPHEFPRAPVLPGGMMYESQRIELLRDSSQPQYVDLRRRVIAGADRYLSLKHPPKGVWSSNLPNAVAALSSAYVLSGEEPYLAKLLEYLRHASHYSDLRGSTTGAADLDLGISLYNLCLALECCGDELDPASRSRLEALLLQEAAHVHELFLPQRDRYFWNHQHQRCIGLYAVAVCYPEAEASAVWRSDVEQFFEAMQNMLDQSSEAVYPEGAAYASIVYTNTAQYNELYRRFHGGVPAHTWWRGAASYFALTRRPDKRGTIRLGDDRGRWFWPPGALLRYSASAYGDGRAQALADEFATLMRGQDINYELMAWQEMLFVDTLVAADPAGIAQSDHFEDSGLYIHRSSQQPNASLLALTSRRPGGSVYNSFLHNHIGGMTAALGHSHADNNSLSWWSGGLALLSDPGHEKVKRTNQHNTLTFSGRGQIGEGGAWWGNDWQSRPWGYGGAITRIEDKLPGLCIAEMQADDSYPPTVPVEAFRRRALWVKPGLLLVQDKVRLSSAQIIEANWLSELGSWQEEDGHYLCKDRLGMAVLGTQPLACNMQSIEVSSGLSAHRLQSRFDAGHGETHLLHIFWDKSAGISLKAINSSAAEFRLEGPGGVIRVKSTASALTLSGAFTHSASWNDF